ncbi:MAG: YihY/virulence factor BrkB family protein [Acidobacteria bacterium]|nr:MAG: YihY/virulence factor BrkB family protein [Acidobacteriota bacterium]PYY16909.1 MAG: YihY/virulence factor BrkB family protein [Acidobacteriota bacterium]
MSLTPDTEISIAKSPQSPTSVRRKAVDIVLKGGTKKDYLPPLARYLMQTEVHTFAFSVAANAVLSFFPFIVLLLTLTHQVFHSQAMYDVVLQLLRSYLPAGQDFVIRSVVALTPHRGMKIFSLAMLLISSTGVFVPLEVALNRVWGFTRNRNYLGNQTMALVIALACGTLALISVALTAKNQTWLLWLFGSRDHLIFRIAAFLVMKMFAIVTSIAMFFIVYWLLPNGKVRPLAVLPGAILTGLVWDLSKYVYILSLRWLDFQDVYGPFALSVTLMFWAFLSGMLLLAGAQFSALRSNRMSTSHI